MPPEIHSTVPRKRAFPRGRGRETGHRGPLAGLKECVCEVEPGPRRAPYEYQFPGRASQQ